MQEQHSVLGAHDHLRGNAVHTRSWHKLAFGDMSKSRALSDLRRQNKF